MWEIIFILLVCVVTAFILLMRGKTFTGRGQGSAPVKYAAYSDGEFAAWNFADDEKITADTKFRVGSITKLFTAVCLLRLERDGRLSLDDTAAKYALGTFGDVTIRELMYHKSGMIPDIQPIPHLQSTDATSAAACFITRGDLFDPAKRGAHSYSNLGYIVLGAIIEAVTGEHYNDAFARLIYAPAGISPTITDELTGYNVIRFVKMRGLGPVETLEPNFATTAGGLRCSVHDLAQFNNYIRAKGLIPMAAHYMRGENIIITGGIPGGDARLMSKPEHYNIKLEAIGYHNTDVEPY